MTKYEKDRDNKALLIKDCPRVDGSVSDYYDEHFKNNADWAREYTLKEQRSQLIRANKLAAKWAERVHKQNEEIQLLREALIACSPAWLPEGVRKKRREALARSKGEGE